MIISTIDRTYPNKRFVLWHFRHAGCRAMATMNSFDRAETTPGEYRPILRASASEPASESQQTECCCPELCQLDHDN